MQVQGAVIKEQGVNFAIVVVKPHVVQDLHEARNVIAGLAPVFGVPVVLMARLRQGAHAARREWLRLPALRSLGL